MKRHITVITDAPQNPEAQFRQRKIKYFTMMALRIVCLIAAAIIVSAQVPYALWWVALCIAGMIFLPWLAVLVANDRPPRKPRALARLLRRGPRVKSIDSPGANLPQRADHPE